MTGGTKPPIGARRAEKFKAGRREPPMMIRLLALVVTIGGLAGPAAAQGITFGGAAPRAEHPYPANPQYQYPYPYDDARAQARKKCRFGEVRHQGKCRPARPLALPF